MDGNASSMLADHNTSSDDVTLSAALEMSAAGGMSEVVTAALVTAAGTGGGTGVRGLERRCFGFDLADRILLNTILGVMGVFGNSITVIVMWSDRKVSSTAFLLLNLAITDTLTLLGYWLAPTLRTLDDVFGTNTGTLLYYGYVVAYLIPVMNCFFLDSTWFIVLVAINRYFSICRPLTGKKWTSIGLTRKLVAVIYVSTVLFNIGRFWQIDVRWIEKYQRYDSFSSNTAKSWWYKDFYQSYVYFLISLIIPSGIMVFVTFHLIGSLKKNKEKMKKLVSQGGSGADSHPSTNKEDLTLSLVSVVVVFVICNFFNPARRVVLAVAGFGVMRCPHPLYPFASIADTVHIFNASCNFVIYMLFGKTFRKKVIKLLKCKKRSQVAPEGDTITNAHTHFRF